jgi:hypothetical protein
VTGFAWLAAFLVLPVCGWALLSHPSYARLSLASRIVLSGAAGGALLSFVMTLFVLAGVRWRTSALVLTTVVLAAGLRAVLRRLQPPPEEGAASAERGALVTRIAQVILLAAVAAALAAAASGAASSPDLLFFWGPKAQHSAMARTIDPAFLGGAFHNFMHPYYPPLVTNLYAFASMAAGRLPWTAAILTFPLILGALALGLPGVLRRSIGRPYAFAASALAIGAMTCVGIEADIGGNGEMPLLLFETLATAVLLSPAAAQRPMQILAGLLLAGAAATKVEGLPFAIAAAALAAILRPGAWTARARALAILLAPTAAALGAWFAFGASRGLFTGYSGTGRVFDIHPDHAWIVIRSIAYNLLAVGRGLPWLVPFACLAFALPLARRAAIPLGTAAGLTAFFLFTYIHRAEDPSQWISWSAARIFSPVAMLLALAVTATPNARSGGGEAPRTGAGSPG